MKKRFLTIWFRYLKTDWLIRRRPDLKNKPIVFCLPDHGRMIITALNRKAEEQGINKGMAVADARAIFPGLEVFDDKPELLIKKFANYCIRYSPIVAIDPPDGLILD